MTRKSLPLHILDIRSLAKHCRGNILQKKLSGKKSNFTKILYHLELI